jgi:hypothetical protein
MTVVSEIYERAEAFLLGRRTHELFAGYLRLRSGSAIADALNARPKYVPSTTLIDAR